MNFRANRTEKLLYIQEKPAAHQDQLETGNGSDGPDKPELVRDMCEYVPDQLRVTEFPYRKKKKKGQNL